MKKIFLLLILIAVMGCGREENKPIFERTGPLLSGKILFTRQNKGIYIYESGKINFWMENAYRPTWLGNNQILYCRDSTRPHVELHNIFLSDYYVAGYSSKEEKLLFKMDKTILLKGAFSEVKRFYGEIWEKGKRGWNESAIIYYGDSGQYEKITNLEADRVSIRGIDLNPAQNTFVVSYLLENGNMRSGNMVLMDLRGEIIKDFKDDGTGASWSPDGRYLVFSKKYKAEIEDPYLKRDTEIAVYDMETDEIKRLTHQREIVSDPVFSPDGKMIAFVQWQSGGFYKNLAVMNVDGTGYQLLLSDEEARNHVSDIQWVA